MVQAADRPALMPSEGVLALHDRHQLYQSFEQFQPHLAQLLQEGSLLDDCTTVTRIHRVQNNQARIINPAVRIFKTGRRVGF